MLKKILLALVSIITFATFAIGGNLKVKIYNPGSNAIFNVTSTIIYGDKDAVLIDAQFQKKYALGINQRN